MVVLKSGISWCSGTLNAWIGCHKVSAGCDHCYAETLVSRFGKMGDGPGETPAQRAAATRAGTMAPFNQIVLHLDRLAQIRKMRPHVEADGKRRPYLCFVNSMSDFWHDDVPDAAIHQALDAFEAAPDTIFQILTKRPVRARKLLIGRYANSGLPDNLWIGASVEDNRVAARLNIMRTIKGRCGGNGTFFVSVEPIIGPTDAINFEAMDWIITGGESGPGARVMQRDWLLGAVNAARRAGIPLWHKQSGQPRSHPNWDRAPAALKQAERFRWLIDNGWERLPDEKGGATIDRATYRQFPAHYHQLSRRLNERAARKLI
jgi:protein gp37